MCVRRLASAGTCCEKPHGLPVLCLGIQPLQESLIKLSAAHRSEFCHSSVMMKVRAVLHLWGPARRRSIWLLSSPQTAALSPSAPPSALPDVIQNQSEGLVPCVRAPVCNADVTVLLMVTLVSRRPESCWRWLPRRSSPSHPLQCVPICTVAAYLQTLPPAVRLAALGAVADASTCRCRLRPLSTMSTS